MFQFTHMPAKCKCVFLIDVCDPHRSTTFLPIFHLQNCSNPPPNKKKTASSWPFFPHPPNFIKLDHFPRCVHIKNLWNHHSRELSSLNIQFSFSNPSTLNPLPTLPDGLINQVAYFPDPTSDGCYWPPPWWSRRVRSRRSWASSFQWAPGSPKDVMEILGTL